VHGGTSPACSWREVVASDGQAIKSVGAGSDDESPRRAEAGGAEGDGEPPEEGDTVEGDAHVPVLTEVEGTATDPGVPRYRPHVVMAASALDGPGAQKRSEWQAKYNAARGTQARIVCKAGGNPMARHGASTTWSRCACRSCLSTWNC
jgi:prophage tail gpP-like protein